MSPFQSVDLGQNRYYELTIYCFINPEELLAGFNLAKIGLQENLSDKFSAI